MEVVISNASRLLADGKRFLTRAPFPGAPGTAIGSQSGTVTFSRPGSAAGNLGSMASRVSAMVRATTRLRYHFLLAGTTYQGAYSVEHSLTASSNAAW